MATLIIHEMSRKRIKRSEYVRFDSEHDALVYLRELVAEHDGRLLSERDGQYTRSERTYRLAVSPFD